MLRKANIKFEWKIFTNSKVECDYEEIHIYRQRFDIWDYLVEADYTVLLSDSEGMPYTVQESLQYGTPCIVTDVGGCTELIKDGINGYVVPLQMEFDITKLLKIPKLKEYDNHAKEKWLEYLGNSYYIDKEEEETMSYLVRATAKYELTNTSDSERATAKKVDRYIPKAGEEWIVDMYRRNTLVSQGFVEEVKEIVETAQKEVKTEKAVKKTTKTTKKSTKK